MRRGKTRLENEDGVDSALLAALEYLKERF